MIATISKISVYDLSKEAVELKNHKNIYSFENLYVKDFKILFSPSKIGVLIRYVSKEVVFEYDIVKAIVLNPL